MAGALPESAHCWQKATPLLAPSIAITGGLQGREPRTQGGSKAERGRVGHGVQDGADLVGSAQLRTPSSPCA